MSGEPILSVRGLTVGLPEAMDRESAVSDVSFGVSRNEILCIVGESGSGKSVTANAIMGLLPPALKLMSGRISLCGHELTALSEKKLRSLRGRVASIIFQDPLSALNPLMRIRDQIIEIMEIHGVGNVASRKERVIELLEEVGLPDPHVIQHRYPFGQSGGQRQRVMIAIALALDPDLLIADEPTTALDVTTQAQILDLIRRIQKRKGMGVMFITHDFGVVAEIADRVIVMEKGILVEQGPAEQMLSRPTHPYTKKLLAAVPRLATEPKARDEKKEQPLLLKVEGVIKIYRATGGLFSRRPDVSAVNDVHFELARGRTLGIVGESGSGKSTLGKILLKLTPNDGGRILFEGRDIAGMAEKDFRPFRPRIQMIFQDPFASLNPRHTIATILKAGPRAAGMPEGEADEKAKRLLQRVGLTVRALGRYPHEFSGGQRQRIGIARALMFSPDILVADEAVSALDVSIQAQILDLLREIQAETSVSLIFITHDLRVASQLCDEIVVMLRGQIVERGSPRVIFTRPENEYTKRLVAALPGTEWQNRAAAGLPTDLLHT